jgi:hypothetical protein
MLFTCAAGQESDGSSAVKIRIKLTGGISFKSLQPAEPEFAPFDGLQDSWPIEDLTLDLYAHKFESEYDVLAWAFQSLAESDIGHAMINAAIHEGWQAGLADLGAEDFYIDMPERVILLNHNGMNPAALSRSVYFRQEILSALSLGLRDLWHEKRHGGFDEVFNAESILLLERVRAADCQAMALLMAWELRAEGHIELWRHYLSSEDGDIARVFAERIEIEGLSYPVHEALQAAFDQWFRLEKRATERDHATLEYIDEVIKAYGGQALGKKRAHAGDIEILSCLPDRTAYLQGAGGNILNAPFYAGLQD